MRTWIAFFRGINVGGRNVIPMQALRESLTADGLRDVATHIQSGNVVFRSATRSTDKLASRIERTVKRDFGIAPAVQVRTVDQIEAAIDANPFPGAQENRLHFGFLDAPARSPDMEAMNALKADSESFVLTADVFYLHAPDGIGRSKLAARAETLLGVSTTGRNLRTVTKVLSLARKVSG